jgi:hypothetical protein
MATKTAAKKMTPVEQSAAFKAKARELGADESPAAFDALLKRAAKPAKPK